MKKRILVLLLATSMLISSVSAMAVENETPNEAVETEAAETEALEEEKTEAAEAEALEEEKTEVAETEALAEEKEETEEAEETEAEDCMQVSTAETETEETANTDGESEETQVSYVVGDFYVNDLTAEDIEAVVAETDAEELLSASGSPYKFEAKSEDEAIEKIRNAFRWRNALIEVTFDYQKYDVQDDKGKYTQNVVKKAISEEYATNVKEGDYITVHLGGFKQSISGKKATFEIVWASTLDQENKVDAEIKNIVKELNLGARTEYGKIKVIHDYIVNNVSYINNSSAKEYNSAYAALINHKSSGRGYAALFYRLCKEAKVPVRIIHSNSLNHFFNIVKMGQSWYNMDTCWDDPEGGSAIRYTYFMKADYDFDHPRDDEYRTAEFMKKHPMASMSLAMGSANPGDANYFASLKDIYDSTIYTTATDGRSKIIVFAGDGKGYGIPESGNTVRSLSESRLSKDTDVYVVVQGGKDAAKNFRALYDPKGYLKFGYGDTDVINRLAWYYYSHYNTENLVGISYPFTVVIGGFNNYAGIIKGETTAEAITAKFKSDVKWPFTDVERIKGNWKYEAVKFAYDNDMMKGVTDTTFRPQDKFIRGQFATVIYAMAGKPATTFDKRFTDVTSGWYYAVPIIWANDIGIIQGYGKGKFGPKDPITREQLALMLYNYAKYRNKDVSGQDNLSRFQDAATVGKWALPAVKWAVKEGIISGITVNNKLLVNPKGNATRVEAAAMLQRYVKKYGK